MKYIMFMLIVLGSAFAKAQSLQDLVPQIEQRPRQITDTLDRDYDQRAVEARALPADLADNYTGADFDYTDTTNDVNNVFEEFFEWLFQGIASIFGVELSPFWLKFLQYTVYVLFAALAIYLLVRLLGKEQASGLTIKAGKKKASIRAGETHIEEIDLNKLIADAVNGNDYRSAIRYQYLNVLKKLSAAGVIVWDYQKTNADYYREIKKQEVKDQFKRISYLYDHVWYGEFAVDRKVYDQALVQFNDIKKTAA
ncbi:hypothetical protein [Nonlabens ponticola]|uniref:Protein-glutamine gamma-glutamyltransferase-like C-terminal domain-containing protein n=1 Tax=Nonlabens ponticola TaxID=2496866 RepID=A0A3S9MXW4_9FLAO|nr:hypothetical protein [Nonlabens ponticola]AZQ43978.1 hypothetical protein EJ995_06925 [Nonlabens ponticola]